jgi:hypothetical protein
MKVWLVGSNDVEMTYIQHVCLSEKTALRRWEEVRQALIKECQDSIEWSHKNNGLSLEMYERMLENLSNTNPKTMDNYPQNEPFIDEMEAEE